MKHILFILFYIQFVAVFNEINAQSTEKKEFVKENMPKWESVETICGNNAKKTDDIIGTHCL